MTTFFNTEYIRFSNNTNTYTIQTTGTGFRYFLIAGLVNNIGIYVNDAPELYFIVNTYDGKTTKLYSVTSNHNIKSVSYSNGTLSIVYNTPYSIGILLKI